MHALIWCGGGAVLRTGLSAPPALSGAVPAVPLRQYLRVGDCQGAGGCGRLAGAFLHAVFPLCLGRGADYRGLAFGGADTYAFGPSTSSGTVSGTVSGTGSGTVVRVEFRAFVPALALPA